MPTVSTQTHSDGALQKDVTVQVDYRSIVCETMSDISQNEWDTHSSSQSADGRHYENDSETDSANDREVEEVEKKEVFYEIKEFDQCTTTVETETQTLRCQNYKNYATQICSDCKRGRPFFFTEECDSPPKKK
tara:strand:+ start:3390 stop:3788 length:399 start_codon:yes stop_codon:yes gene_type:complete